MNSTNNFDEEIPFVREECGDTMWDEDVLNRLTEVIALTNDQPNSTDKKSGN